jgi:hypothetical protein
MITANGLIKLGFKPLVDFTLQDNADGKGVYIAEWLSTKTQPTKAAIGAATTQAQAEYDANQYARNRAEAYPSLNEQADMAYWDRQNNTTTLDDALSAVKTEFPKG